MKVWTIVKRAGLAALAIISLLVIVLVGVIVLDPLFGGPSSQEVGNITYRDADGNNQTAYIAYPPEGTSEVSPGVIMFHEWWGMNEEIVEMADLLAEEGYVVFVPDLYRGRSASTVPRALYLRLTISQEQVDADADAAFAQFSTMESIDPQHYAAIGFCFGGGVSLRLATRHADDLSATVTLYGDTPADPAALGELRDNGPLFGLYGEDDTMIPVEDVNRFEEALQAANVEHTIRVYPDVGHAFVQPDAINQPGSPRVAWQDILAFLDEM